MKRGSEYRMAIRAIAPMSSAMARVSRKIRRLEEVAGAECEDGHGEGDVGGHGDRPYRGGSGLAPGHGQGEGGRDDHAAGCGDDREHGAFDVVEFADDEFAFEFEAHDQEEERQEEVGRPVLDVEHEDAVDADVGVPDLFVQVRQPRVGHDQRQDGADEQQDASGGLDAQEPGDLGAGLANDALLRHRGPGHPRHPPVLWLSRGLGHEAPSSGRGVTLVTKHYRKASLRR
ncbi:hypothetical protein GCM10029992_05120 [Glycomyces albus]